MRNPESGSRVKGQLRFLLLAAPFVAGSALAQTPPPRPDAGSVLQQIQPSVTPPAAAASAPNLTAPRAVSAPSAGGGAKVSVKSFRIAGVSAARAAELQPLLQRYVGSDRSLADLEDAAKDVEVALQRQGLFLAQAYIPEQTLADGVVTVQVLEGRIGAVKVELEPGVSIAPEFLDRIVAILRGNPVAERELIERALFTLGDLRGIAVSTSLSPGDKIGQADLTVKVSPSARWAANVDADSGGSIFTGRYRVMTGFDWFNPTGHGDIASLRAQATTNLGAKFIRGSWLTPINAMGTKVGVAVSYLKYELGSPVFEDLDADGTAEAYSLQLLHPLIRSRNNNLFIQASADYRRFEDRVNAISLVTRKDISPYATLGVVGDFRDTLGGGGISNYSLGVVGGRLRIKNAEDIVVDEQNYQAAGRYAKVALGATRLQALPTRDYLYLAVIGQLASKNLDSSEKFSLGGPNGVRAYPSPESPSDSGLVATWEYRKSLPIESLPGEIVAWVFGDYGVGRLHQDPLPTDTGNTRKLLSHGVGLTYAGKSGLNVKSFLALRGGTKAQSDDSKARFYLLVSQQF
jgi:hemolysin activation/secretion protein